jgi:anti-repressor protein
MAVNMEQKALELLTNAQTFITELSSELEKALSQNAELKNEVKTWEMVSSTDDLIAMDEVAKSINFKGYGRNKIFELLRDNGVLRYNNQPYQANVDAGHFKLIEQTYDNGYGQVKISLKTVVTQKGLDFIRKKLSEVVGE